MIKGVEIGALTTGAGGTGVAVIERRIPRVPAPRRPADSLLIGREAALQNAAERLRRGEKFYFHGTYGVGKTTLSSELFNRVVAAGEPSDGYLWGSVAGMGIEDALEWIAGALQETAVSETANTQAKINALRQAISVRKQLLIALDDVRDGSVAQALIEATGDCALILNGARNLDLGGQVFTQELEPLTADEARTLFLREAYPLDTTIPAVELEQIDRIVERAGRLPLTVRLTARQRKQGVSTARLLDILAYSPESVFSTEEGLLVYLRSLQQELDGMAAARRLLARLAAFPAHHASIEALQAALPRRDYYTAESFLVERSIVDRMEGDRLRLHGFLALWFSNAFPQDCDAERPVVEGWLGDFARRSAQADNFAALELEQANLLGLLERFKEEQRRGALVDLLRSLFDYLRARGMWGMNVQALDAALDDPNALGDETLAGWSYMQRGYMHTLRGERSGAEQDLAQADRIFARAGDLAQRGETWYRQSALTQMSGDLDGATAQLEQALAWMGDTAPARARAGAHQRLATLYATQGRLTEAEAHCRRAIALGDAEVQATAYTKLGGLRRDAGDPGGAQAYFEQALPLIERLGLTLQRAQLLQEMGMLAMQSGQRDQARSYYESASNLYAQLNYPAGLAYIQHLFGNLAFAAGSHSGGGYGAARQHYMAALELNLSQGLEANAAYNRFMLGVTAHRMQKLDEAAHLYGQALQAAQDMGDLGLQASCLYQLANLAFDEDKLPDTSKLAEQARSLAVQSGDRQTEASALALLACVDAAQGKIDAARKGLSQAYTLFASFNSPDAQKVADLLAALDPTLAGGTPGAFDLDRVEGGGHILQGNIDTFGSGRDAGEPAKPPPTALPTPGLVPAAASVDIWRRSSKIDRIEDGGVFRDFSVEPGE
jgi:tetratricopeptide (TPR) repeat protein